MEDESVVANDANEKADGGPSGAKVPPGNSAVEIAARKGFGPLSALANKVWHGDARPCVSCGELVRRGAVRCESCGEQLSSEMQERMRAHAGPWYVLEHVRPFPGVTCERLVRQIRRGVLTRMTIVRGPTTDHQWRFAGETPGLCKHLGVCWNCQGGVSIERDTCPACGVELGELTDEIGAGQPAARTAGPVPAEAADIRELQNVVKRVPRTTKLEQDAPRIGAVKASWVAAAIVIVLIGVLFAVVSSREAGTQGQTQSQTGQVSE